MYWFINIGDLLAVTFVGYLQQNVSFLYGNLVPACSLILALIIFLSGKWAYVPRPPAGTVQSNILIIAKEAIKRSRRPSLSCLFVDHWLDRAKMCFGGSYSSWEVEDVKKVYRLLPIFGSFIIYWTVYAQVSLENWLQEEMGGKFYFLILLNKPFKNFYGVSKYRHIETKEELIHFNVSITPSIFEEQKQI